MLFVNQTINNPLPKYYPQVASGLCRLRQEKNLKVETVWKRVLEKHGKFLILADFEYSAPSIS